MTGTIIRGFVSSTWIDLQPERRALENVLNRMRQIKFEGMEYFGSQDAPPKKASLQEVNYCQLYIGVFGGRYGSGITAEEHRKAVALSLPCFIYIKDDSAIPDQERDNDPDKTKKLEKLKHRLRREHTCSLFTSPDDLAAKFAADVSNWLFDRYSVQGLAHLPQDYGVRIRNFLTEYLGRHEQAVPFGGREADLAQLDSWLDGPQKPPYLLLSAPAGRGKSALLTRWSQRLSRREDVAVVFFPISIRFRTNLASVVFSSLAARLSLLHGTPIAASPDTPVEVWRVMVTNFLARPLPDGRILLLILDGLDEAADWEPGADLFPSSPCKGVRIAISARYLAQDSGSSGWMRRLGWQCPDLALAMDLAPLTQAGVQAALVSMGVALERLCTRVDIISELHRLTEGDPLLVHLYAHDLALRGDSVATMAPSDLQALRSGLDGYFDRWWDDQRLQWGPEKPLREPEVQTLLDLMSGALGPLSQEDLLALMPTERRLTSLSLREALRSLARFILGDGRTRGYTFSHPRLGDYFHTNLTAAERQAVQSRFIDYGGRTLTALTEKTIRPADASAYIVQHYGAHLEKASGNARAFLSLVCDEWRQARHEIEGTHSGFLNDVVRARVAAECADHLLVRQKQPASHMGDEVRCGLCQSSIRTVAGNIPSDLLLALVASRVWNPIQGLGYARLISSAERRVAAIAGLVQFLPPDIRAEAFGELLAAARSIEGKYERLQALDGLMRVLPEPFKIEALEAMRTGMDIHRFTTRLVDEAPLLPEPYRIEALEATLRAEKNFGRVYRLTRLMAYLSEPHQSRALKDARESAAAIENPAERSRAMRLLLPWLSEAERNDLVSAALKVIHATNERKEKITDLTDLATRLTGVQRRELLEQALQLARSGALDPKERISALANLAPHLPDPLKEAVLSDILTTVRGARTEEYRDVVANLAPHLPGRLMAIALDFARTMQSDDTRASLLMALAPHVPGDLQESVLIEARKMPGHELPILMQLIPSLPPGSLTDVHHSALARARAIAYGPSRVTAIVELTPYLPEALKRQVLVEALSAAQVIFDRAHQAAALAAMAMHWPTPSAGAVVNEALATIPNACRDSDILVGTIEILVKAALRLRHEESARVFDELQAVTLAFKNDHDRLSALLLLLPHIPRPQRDKAFNVVRRALTAEEHGQPLAFDLAKLAAATPHLSKLTRDGLLRDAAAAARALLSEEKADFLAKLVEYLPWAPRRRMVNEALTAALERGSGIQGRDRTQVAILTRLVPHLSFWRRIRLLRKVLTEIGGYMNRQKSCAALVAAFAPYLSGRARRGLLAEALSGARTIVNNRPHFASTSEGETAQHNMQHQAETLTLLMPHLPPAISAGACNEALALARGLQDQHSRFFVLGGLVPHLSEPLRGEVMVEIITISETLSAKGWDFGSLLAEMVSYMSEDLLARSLMVALTISDGGARRKVLAALSPRLEAMACPERLLALWHDALATIVKRERADLLGDLSGLMGVIATLGADDAVRDTCMATQAVCRWWP